MSEGQELPDVWVSIPSPEHEDWPYASLTLESEPGAVRYTPAEPLERRLADAERERDAARILAEFRAEERFGRERWQEWEDDKLRRESAERALAEARLALGLLHDDLRGRIEDGARFNPGTMTALDRATAFLASTPAGKDGPPTAPSNSS